MQEIGNYTVRKKFEDFRIFPRNKDGEVIPLTVSRRIFELTHKSGDAVVFKNYFHRGAWLWSDSRRGPCDVKHIITEVARMLFRGNSSQAEAFIA